MKDYLVQLPPELLIRISSHLTTPELGCLRRACKSIEAALFDSFAKEFFTKKQFMIEHVSLQALVDIANHPILSTRLSQVIISLHIYRPYEDTDGIAYEKRHGYPFISHDTLLNTGLARDMLVEAFSKLPNLHTVGFRDYNSRGRFRDGESAAWKSYGWSRESERDPPVPLEMFTQNPESVWPLVMYALGCAQAKPTSIEVFLRRRPKLPAASFNIVNGVLGTKVVPVLEGVKKLMLSIAVNSDWNATWRDNDKATDDRLKQLVCHMPELEYLRLNFEAHLFAPNRFSSLVIPLLSLSSLNITSLDLGMLSADPGLLTQFVTKFRLVSLSLWKVTLQSKDGHELYREPSLWSDFIGAFAKQLSDSTCLKAVLIGFPSQGLGRASLQSVYFLPEDTFDRTRLDKVTYWSGHPQTIKHWLSDLAGRMTYKKTDAESEDDDDMESEEDDYDENDEDDEDMEDDDEDDEAEE